MENEYKELLQKCKKERWRLLPSVLIFSGIGLRAKISALIMNTFPIFMAKRSAKKSNKALEADTME